MVEAEGAYQDVQTCALDGGNARTTSSAEPATRDGRQPMNTLRTLLVGIGAERGQAATVYGTPSIREENKMHDFRSKTAGVIAGGALGIGLALARAFVGEGANVVIADIEQAALDTAISSLGRDSVVGVRTDVTDPTSVEALADATYEAFGACHVLCNKTRRRRSVGERVGRHGERLALGARRERDGCGARLARLRPAHAGRRQVRSHRQHVVG